MLRTPLGDERPTALQALGHVDDHPETAPRVGCRSKAAAVQAVAVVHDTPFRAAWSWVPGISWMDHEVPSHRSAKAPPGIARPPTAIQALDEAHDTLLSRGLEPLVVG